MLFPGSNHSIKKRAYMADVQTHFTFAVIEDDDVAINLSIRLSIEFCKSMVEKTPALFLSSVSYGKRFAFTPNWCGILIATNVNTTA